MKHLIGKKVLATTQNWFHRPDGTQARAVWGTLKAIHTTQETLGFTPSRAHTNWVVEIGNMIITGCQILYISHCPKSPNFTIAQDYEIINGEVKYLTKPSPIYNADENKEE